MLIRSSSLFALCVHIFTVTTIGKSSELEDEHDELLLYRWAIGRGFHRQMGSQVLVPNKFMISEMYGCKFILKESLPSGLFVDTYQLDADLVEGGPFVYTKEKIDVESPEYMSPQHTIHVYGDLTREEVYWKGTVQYPIHLRYHSPSEDGENDSVRFEHPKLLISADCVEDRYSVANILLPCGSDSHHTCAWVVLPYVSDSNSVNFDVPVGSETHLLMVTIGTLASTVLGCIVLIYGAAQTNIGKQKAE